MYLHLLRRQSGWYQLLTVPAHCPDHQSTTAGLLFGKSPLLSSPLFFQCSITWTQLPHHSLFIYTCHCHQFIVSLPFSVLSEFATCLCPVVCICLIIQPVVIKGPSLLSASLRLLCLCFPFLSCYKCYKMKVNKVDIVCNDTVLRFIDIHQLLWCLQMAAWCRII